MSEFVTEKSLLEMDVGEISQLRLFDFAKLLKKEAVLLGLTDHFATVFLVKVRKYCLEKELNDITVFNFIQSSHVGKCIVLPDTFGSLSDEITSLFMMLGVLEPGLAVVNGNLRGLESFIRARILRALFREYKLVFGDDISIAELREKVTSGGKLDTPGLSKAFEGAFEDSLNFVEVILEEEGLIDKDRDWID